MTSMLVRKRNSHSGDEKWEAAVSGLQSCKLHQIIFRLGTSAQPAWQPSGQHQPWQTSYFPACLAC